MIDNPYAAPKATVSDTPLVHREDEGEFLPDGRRVGIERGWNWIAESWSYFSRQWGMWILLGLIFMLMVFGVSMIPKIGQVASMLLYTFIWAGAMLAAHAQFTEGHMSLKNFFAGFHAGGMSMVLLALVATAADLVILFLIAVIADIEFSVVITGELEHLQPEQMLRVMLGYLVGLALWLPFTMAVWFAPGLIALHRVSVGRAISVSFIACLKNFLPFLLYGIILFVFLIVASIPLLLGLFVLVPISLISIYTSYRDIFYTS